MQQCALASTSSLLPCVQHPFGPAVKRARRCVLAAVGPGQVNWDPDNVLGAPQTGHINRRMMHRQMQQDKEFAATVQRTSDEGRKQVLLRRQSRVPPEDHFQLIEFFLNTDAEDMEWEVARCRPKMTPDFFKQLDTLIGQERFAAKPDEERLAELDTLRQYLDEAREAVDKAVASTTSAVDRVKKLLTAQDKKTTIREMAENNEIDQALMDLLQQNIDAARNAEQEQAALFMEKVKTAAAKFFVAVPSGTPAVRPPQKKEASVLSSGAPAADTQPPTNLIL
eukprot:jgi/Chrzof1/14174/Cz08g28060.t1